MISISNLVFFLIPVVQSQHTPGIGSERMTTEAKEQGLNVIATDEIAKWWDILDKDDQTKFKNVFDEVWFDQQDMNTQASYAHLASSLYSFLGDGSTADAHDDDFYFGFAPMMLRASFHSSATYDLASGTGGSNGGTVFHDAELADENNGCIVKATEQLQALFQGHTVPLADAAVIAGAIALDVMNFPRMDLVRIEGGRVKVEDVAFVGRLPSADDDPMEKFLQQYGLTLEESVALIGGAHNFGSSHGKCAGYIGQWTATPLNWFGPGETAPTFFPDLLRDDWKWYEVCTYENNTVSYSSIEDPFVSGSVEEEEEHGDDSTVMACPVMQSRVPLICEEQAMRGCDFADGSYDLAESPCDIDQLQLRLKSDFFLKENEKLLPYAKTFADNPEALAEQFGIAYHKITHLGLNRCGMSGHGCLVGTVCTSSDVVAATCVIDEDSAVLMSQGGLHLGRGAQASLLVAVAGLLVLVLLLLFGKKSTTSRELGKDSQVSSDSSSTASGTLNTGNDYESTI